MEGKKTRPVLFVLAAVLASTLAAGAEPEDTIVVRWNDQALRAIRDTRPGPPMAARMLAVTHTCMYDAWAAFDAKASGTRLGSAFRAPANLRTKPNQEQAISFAAYRCLADLFPQAAEAAGFTSFMQSLGYDPTDVSMDTRRPAGIGNIAAQAVLDFRHHDGSNQLGELHAGAYSDYSGYVPVNDPFHVRDPNGWQPLQISDGRGGTVIQQFTAPFWQNVTPFALTSAAQFRPAGGLATFGTAGYKQQVDEILSYSGNLTDAQKAIAEYWADGPNSETPPGHWTLFAEFVSRRDRHTVDQDVKMFFAVANALLDASIAAWDAKRAYDSVRPVTAVHVQYAGQKVRAWAGPGLGTQWIAAELWRPYQPVTVVTPPFPEYFSGHSIFSAAAAEVLRLCTHSDRFGASVTIGAGQSRVEPGLVPATPVTLRWATFSDAADQAGLSRRFGGIHFVQGDLDGRIRGRWVGQQAWEKAQSFFESNPRARDDP